MHPSFHPLFVEFCIYFNGNQDFFECHEVLEEYWKEIAPSNKQHILVGFIQLATGMYHWRRGNYNGAYRTFKRAFTILRSDNDSPLLSPFDIEDLYSNLEASIGKTSSHEPFHLFTLKIIDADLKKHIDVEIKKLPVQTTEYILHKHKLRDRTDIVMARQKKLAQKRME